MTTPPVNPDDPLVKLVAGIIVGAGILNNLNKLMALIPAVKRRNAKKQKDTDEHNALVIASESLKLQNRIMELQGQLSEREAQLMRAERTIEALTPLANETEALREANAGLEKELKALRERRDLQ